jgi:hypothetical protein
MPGKPTSGNRSGARGKPTRVRWRVSKEAAKRLDSELAWAAEEVQDAILSELILHAPHDLFHVAAECVREMGGANEPEDKPIIL